MKNSHLLRLKELIQILTKYRLFIYAQKQEIYFKEKFNL